MIWLSLIGLTLAASRVTRLVVSDSITQRLREKIWRRYPASDTIFGDTEVDANGTDTLGNQIGQLGTGVDVFRTTEGWFATTPRAFGELISCAWCTGIYVAVAAWVGWWFYPDIVIWLAPLAISELIGLLHDR